jgi:hypothetical protein
MGKSALLIGINYFGTENALGGCINDVHRMKKLLIEHYNYTEEDMVILTDDTTNPNLMPTGSNIVKSMQMLVQNASDGDQLFLHYSGHGSYMDDTNSEEDDHRDECLVPVDHENGMLLDDQIRQILIDPLKKGVHLTCVMDCCHSGTLCDLKYHYMVKPKRGEKRKRLIQNLAYAASSGQVVTISGCRDTQTSADAWVREEASYNGALTYTLCQTLSQCSYNTNYRKLMKTLRRNLRAGDYEQIPQLCSGQKMRLQERFTM